jgi:hypothetical protein
MHGRQPSGEQDNGGPAKVGSSNRAWGWWCSTRQTVRLEQGDLQQLVAEFRQTIAPETSSGPTYDNVNGEKAQLTYSQAPMMPNCLKASGPCCLFHLNGLRGSIVSCITVLPSVAHEGQRLGHDGKVCPGATLEAVASIVADRTLKC